MILIKARHLYIVLILAALIIISGCTPECSRNTDCTAKPGYSARCSQGKCVEVINANSCGNSVCEQSENSCTCPSDCGSCAGKEGQLERSCSSKKECVLSLNQDNVREASFTETLDIRVASLDMRYSYYQPFDTAQHLFKVTFSLANKQDDVTKITIKKIRVLEVDRSQRSTKLFGEAELNQFFWIPSAKLEAEFPLAPQLSNITGEQKPVELEINYEYILKSGSVVSSTVKKELPGRILFVKSGIGECPSSCEDNNPCTIDACSASSNYFCTHELGQGSCCGNTKCEPNENECTCARDCGSCDRPFGKYMAYSCSGNACAADLIDAASVKPKTLVIQASFTEFTIENKISFEEPFSIRQSKFTIVSEVNNIRQGISGIKCTKLQLLDNTELLAEKAVSLVFSKNLDKATTILPAAFTSRNPETTKNPQLKLFCEYDKAVSGAIQHNTQAISQQLGSLVFISPG
ncbi:hypothetical protein HYV81_02090 [Candidatus Woesearchaeota archaeon]|nr:hypothetical protein [Candidatus Woesearchaeota archaeon]